MPIHPTPSLQELDESLARKLARISAIAHELPSTAAAARFDYVFTAGFNLAVKNLQEIADRTYRTARAFSQDATVIRYYSDDRSAHAARYFQARAAAVSAVVRDLLLIEVA